MGFCFVRGFLRWVLEDGIRFRPVIAFVFLKDLDSL